MRIRPQWLKYRLVLAAILALLSLAAVYQWHTAARTVRLEVGQVGDETYLANFYAQESNPDFNYRWSRGDSYINLAYPGAPYILSFRAAAPRPDGHPVTLEVIANSKTLGQFQLTNQPQVYQLPSRQILWGPEQLSLTLRVHDTLAEPGGRGDLGVALDWIEVGSGGRPVIPPPFVTLWWLLLAAFPLWLARQQGLPARWGWVSAGLSLAVILGLHLFTSTARLLWTDWLITGLQIGLGQLILIGLLSWFGRTRLERRASRFHFSPVLWLFLGLLLFYLATARGYFSYGDDSQMEAVAANIAEGQPAAPINSALLQSKYGIGQSLVGTPFFMVGQWLAQTLPFMTASRNGPGGLIIYVVLLLGPLVTALTACSLYWLSRLLACSRGIAFAVGLLYGLTTESWHYARTFLSEPLVALCLTTALAATLTYTSSRQPKWLWLIGFTLGLAIATRSFNLAVLPVWGIWLGWLWWRGNRKWLDGLKQLLAVGLPIVGWLVIIGWWNWARFGNPSETGYGSELTQFTTPLWDGLYGELFSSGKGFFLYNLTLLGGIAGLVSLVRRPDGKMLGLMVGGVSLIYSLIYATWYEWYGGGVWGPRFLVPLIPLLLVGLGPLLEDLRLALTTATVRKWSAWLLASSLLILVALSFFIQFLSVTVSYQIYASQYAHDPALFSNMLYHLGDSAIVQHFQLWQNQAIPDFAPHFYHDTPFASFVSTFQSACWLTLLGSILWGLLRCWAISRKPQPIQPTQLETTVG